MKKYNYSYFEKGQAMLTAVMFFLVISLTIILGITNPLVKQIKGGFEKYKSDQSYYLAEAALEDAVYRLKTNKTIGSSETIILNGNSASATITTTATGKQITTSSTINNNVRKLETDILMGAGVAFNYGLQAGNGGVDMDGGSTVNGNIYSNGNINAISATITGSAVAADSASLTADISNDTPATPASSITFRNQSSSQDLAQSFQVSNTSPLNKVQFYIKKVGSPANATIRLVADNNGSPSTTQIPIGSVSLNASQVTTNYGWVEVVFASTPSLQPGTTYWIVVDNSSQSSSAYYVIGANNSYSNGEAKTGAYSGSWTATNLDAYFKIYTGGITSQIGGATYSTGLMVGSNGVGNAWANIVKGTSVAGSLYCLTGLNNNKSCNTSKGIPPSQPLPYSDSNIDAWKTDAESGGVITGNYTVGSAGASLGPKKITGNLTVNGGGTLTMTGTLWVVGDVTVTGGGKIVLPANYGLNSGTIISDGRITINGGGSAGSGTSGSYLFVVSTSKCPQDVTCGGSSAITITGGAGAIAANAQQGTVALSGGANIKAVVGNSISITGGSTVTYDQGLASPSFVSGPTGGWQIVSWKEVE